jgi:hypothetical protein
MLLFAIVYFGLTCKKEIIKTLQKNILFMKNTTEFGKCTKVLEKKKWENSNGSQAIGERGLKSHILV